MTVSPETATPPAEQPAEGGSYVRNEDDSLTRVAFTRHEPDPDAMAADDSVDAPAIDAPEQEG